MNKIYRVHVFDNTTYIICANSKEEAQETAKKMYTQRVPYMCISPALTPCQIGQDCPDNLDCNTCVAAYAKEGEE